MRWESQTIEAEDGRKLPGFPEAVVRRFEAPEALDVRFHEVQTKSALNRVPNGARLPFEWTVNPYRGCLHACNFCLRGATRVLMADGTHQALADLRVGDELYGTVRGDKYRYLTRTQVLAHWSSVKRAYRVTLADGTELVASADHRFLTARGWKHVIGTERGRTRRPHLTIGGELMGIGTFADQPKQDSDDRAGHLCGKNLDGRAIESNADLRVISIEPLGKAMRLYDITTGTGDFIADGVVSHNCFARPTHEYLDMNAGRDFEREIVVKVNVPEVLRTELARPSWKGAHVALGTNTDPYQWVEGRYKLMRGIWEAMRDFANPCSILTKSPLVLRDADLLGQIAERARVSACLSVPTLDEKTWRATEPHTPHPRTRLEAVAELNRLGIPTGVLIAPLMPGINDSPEQVERIVALATEAGAVHVGGNTLFLRGSVRDIFFEWLREHRPDLLERYEKLYARGAYLPADERRTIERAAHAPWARRAYSERFKHRSGAARGAPAPRSDRDPAKPPAQGSLF